MADNPAPPLSDLLDKSVGKRFAVLESLPKKLDDAQRDALIAALDHDVNRKKPHQDFLAELYDVLARAKGPSVDEALLKGLLREPRMIYLMMRGHLIGRKGAVHLALEKKRALDNGDASVIPAGGVKVDEAKDRLLELLTGLDRIHVDEADWEALGEAGRAALKLTDDFADKRAQKA